MAYCRWSSNFGECDVYVFYHVDEFYATYVANRRFKHPVPQEIKDMAPNALDWANAGSESGSEALVKKLMESEKAFQKWQNSFPTQSMGKTTDGDDFKIPADSEYFDISELGEEAGECFEDASPGECAERLMKLKSKGFLVPQDVIDVLIGEEQERLKGWTD